MNVQAPEMTAGKQVAFRGGHRQRRGVRIRWLRKDGLGTGRSEGQEALTGERREVGDTPPLLLWVGSPSEGVTWKHRVREEAQWLRP